MAGGMKSKLQATLLDLDDAEREALEDGFPIPSKLALENARRLVHAMYGIAGRRYEVYPTPDGEIAIDAPGGTDHGACEASDHDTPTASKHRGSSLDALFTQVDTGWSVIASAG